MSYEKFEVGEIAITQNAGPQFDGLEVEIMGVCSLGYVIRWNGEDNLGFRHKDGDWECEPKYLRKRRPPREDLKIVSWDECPWQPETVRAA